MRALFIAAAGAAAGAVAGAAGVSLASDPPMYRAGYAEDRAQIEDLLGRYALAVDFNDAEGYGALFTEDGVLVHGNGREDGRDAIVEFASGFVPDPEDGVRPSRYQHNITNLVLEVAPDGLSAEGVAEWVQADNANPERRTEIGYFGHSEDKYVKIDGRWYFASREIFNEGLARRAASGQDNPVRHMWEDAPTPTWLEANPDYTGN